MKPMTGLAHALGVLVIAAGLTAAPTVLCPGALIPASGTGGGGTYPTVLPPSPAVMSCAITLPAGATAIEAIELTGLTHTWSGDVQFVLEAPTLTRYNLFNVQGAGAGLSCDFNGDYRIVAPTSLACVRALPTSCNDAAVVAPGNYLQEFGSWPSGSAGVNNVALDSIPIASGMWTLYAYDWAGGDTGNLTSWSISYKTNTGGGPPPPPTNCGPCGGEAVTNNVTLAWSGVERADTYEIKKHKRGGTTETLTDIGSSATTYTFPSPLAEGYWLWQVRAKDLPSGVTSTWSDECCFYVSTMRGLGGVWPGGGAIDGVWPTVLPTGEFSSTINVTVPPNATMITALRLNGLTHTWIGDNQVVLQSPAGQKYNVFQDVDGMFGGGCDDDIDGDVVFVGANPVALPCGESPIGFLCGQFRPGWYNQHYGLWPSGAAGIDNVPLDQIPLAPGLWTLIIYDWYVSSDDGSLDSWDLYFDANDFPPVAYCTAGTTTNGCVASISASANPSVSFANACTISVANVEGQKTGILFYGLSSNAVPWSAGSSSFLCVKPPTQRTFPQSSGGTFNACDGTLVLDWNAYQMANPTALGNPWAAGGKAYVQGWFRDPPAVKTTSLSNALELTWVP